MQLNSAQLAQLKADVTSLLSTDFSDLPHDVNGAFEAALRYNFIAVPDYWVWREVLGEHEITEQTSPDGTTWSWIAYISRSAAEQNGWVRLFNTSLSCNPSRPNVRQGMQDVFSGGQAGAAAQRAHLTSISRRKATRGEKIFAVGSGTAGNPSTMPDGATGPMTYREVAEAMGW